jgi:asparagine synthase (glutamine-hydrolysing)
VQQEAKNQGVTVLIDGQGADEILGGYVFYYTHYLEYLLSHQLPRSFRLQEQYHYINFHFLILLPLWVVDPKVVYPLIP